MDPVISEAITNEEIVSITPATMVRSSPKVSMNAIETRKGILETVAPINAVKSSHEQESEVARRPRDTASLCVVLVLMSVKRAT